MELPDDVLERILKLLPTVDLLRGRAVCKQWIPLTSHLLLSRPPWLFLCLNSSAKQVGYSLAYDIEACEWYKLPMIDLPETHVLDGCVQGLLVARRSGLVSNTAIHIGDPWTGTWTHIQVDSPFTCLRGLHYNQEGNCFAIVASHWRRLTQVTKVFLQSENSTSVDTLMCNPNNFMVERDGKLYSWMRPRGLMVYDAGKGTCTHVQGTKDERREEDRRTKKLLRCGDKLVRICVDHYDNHIFGNERYVKVELLHEDGVLCEPIRWDEVGVMPTHLLDELLDGYWKMALEAFSGGVTLVCFRAQKHYKIITFDLVHRTWNWLPSCPFLAFSSLSKAQCRALKGFSLAVWPRLFPIFLKNQASLSRRVM